MNSYPSLVELRQVTKTYEDVVQPFTALRSIDLTVAQGEFLAVVGKSGSGKSTLLNMLTGIDRPTSGEIIVGGSPLHKLNESQVATWRGRTVGVVFQFFQLLPTLTVLENILLPMDFCGKIPPRQRKDRAMDLLEKIDVASQANKLPAALSGGQQQRVAIARSLANDPDLVVADEPTGNLDSATADTIFSLFAGLVREGKTVIMVTHDREISSRAGRAITLADGQITADSRASARISPRLEAVHG